jgi:hypothetical protein
MGAGFWLNNRLDDTGINGRIILKWILFRDSLFDIVTRLQAGCLRNNGSNPGRDKRFLYSPRDPD